MEKVKLKFEVEVVVGSHTSVNNKVFTISKEDIINAVNEYIKEQNCDNFDLCEKENRNHQEEIIRYNYENEIVNSPNELASIHFYKNFYTDRRTYDPIYEYHLNFDLTGYCHEFHIRETLIPKSIYKPAKYIKDGADVALEFVKYMKEESLITLDKELLNGLYLYCYRQRCYDGMKELAEQVDLETKYLVLGKELHSAGDGLKTEHIDRYIYTINALLYKCDDLFSFPVIKQTQFERLESINTNKDRLVSLQNTVLIYIEMSIEQKLYLFKIEDGKVIYLMADKK